MRKVFFSLFIFVFSIPALADKQQDQFDQKNVYDAFDKLKLEPSTGVLNPAGFSFPFVGRGKLLIRPFKPMLSGYWR